jgi:hypothetical protein
MREVVQRELNVIDIRRLKMHMDVPYGNGNSEKIDAFYFATLNIFPNESSKD